MMIMMQEFGKTPIQELTPHTRTALLVAIILLSMNRELAHV